MNPDGLNARAEAERMKAHSYDEYAAGITGKLSNLAADENRARAYGEEKEAERRLEERQLALDAMQPHQGTPKRSRHRRSLEDRLYAAERKGLI